MEKEKKLVWFNVTESELKDARQKEKRSHPGMTDTNNGENFDHLFRQHLEMKCYCLRYQRDPKMLVWFRPLRQHRIQQRLIRIHTSLSETCF